MDNLRSRSSSSRSRKSSSPAKDSRDQTNMRKDTESVLDSHKLFLTNLNGDYPLDQIQEEIKSIFSKYCQVQRLSLKRHKNGFYYFGFLEFSKGFDASQAVSENDQYSLFGKNMKVQFMLFSLSRLDRPTEGCFICKQKGHFSKQCPQNKQRAHFDNDRKRGGRYNQGDRDFRPRYQDRGQRRYPPRYQGQDRRFGRPPIQRGGYDRFPQNRPSPYGDYENRQVLASQTCSRSGGRYQQYNGRPPFHGGDRSYQGSGSIYGDKGDRGERGNRGNRGRQFYADRDQRRQPYPMRNSYNRYDDRDPHRYPEGETRFGRTYEPYRGDNRYEDSNRYSRDNQIRHHRQRGRSSRSQSSSESRSRSRHRGRRRDSSSEQSRGRRDHGKKGSRSDKGRRRSKS